MKVLIQDALTRSYFQAGDGWTSDPDDALAFKNSQVAADFCLQHHFMHAQVVLKFPDKQYDVQLPITEATYEFAV